MPITSLIDNLHNKAEFAIGRDVALSYCSDTCLLRTLDDHSRIVRTGQSSATALTVIVHDDHLLVPLAGTPRPDAHILGAQHGHVSAHANWEKLLHCQHPALMPVYRICHCMAETQILDGAEFEDAATTPAWKKLRSIVGRTSTATDTAALHTPTFDQWRTWMAELASGLDALEQLGLAHGDPYPFNAVRHAGQASWIDFGHMTDDPEQRTKDAWAFVLFTVLHTQGQCQVYSPALQQELAAALEQCDQPGRFARLRDVLLLPRTDQMQAQDHRLPGLAFIQAVSASSHPALRQPVVADLLLKASTQYFSAFLHHVQRGHQLASAFHTEHLRHRFQEEEMLRLTIPRAEHDNQRHQWLASQRQQEEEIARLQQRLEETGAQLQQQIPLNERLQKAIAERDQYAGQLRTEVDSLFKRHELVLNSRSWKVTRPMRAAAGFYRYGFDYSDGRRALYRMAASIGQKFPFPLWLKARVRNALVDKSSPVTPAHRSHAAAPPSRAHFATARTGNAGQAMRPDCCGLEAGLVSVVLPVYNQATLLAESVDSVLAQTYQNFELIIINDGSTDDVEAVLARYLDHPKVRCFSQSNQRLPKALSNGFDHARGEFWTWTSADNIMEPTMLEKLVGQLQQEPTLGLVYADYYAIDDRGALLQDTAWRAHNRPQPASAEIRLPQTTEQLNTVQDNFIGPCFMYRGWIGQCIGDYDTQLGIEDYDYWMRINAFFPMHHLGDDSLLYRYRVHDNTLSAQASEHQILDKVQLLMKYEQERAAFYRAPLAFIADEAASAWLAQYGIAAASLDTASEPPPKNAVIVVSGDVAEKQLQQLRISQQPVIVLFQHADSNQLQLRQILASGHCAVLALDSLSAQRVRLVSNCPIFDGASESAVDAVNAFAKNLLFVRTSRSADAMRRIAPRFLRPTTRRHVLLQVDSFTQGGMENVVIDLGLSLQQDGYDVTIANFGKSGDAAAKARELGLTVADLSADVSDDAYVSWLRARQVEIVNAHYSLKGAAAIHGAGIPFIQTIHNAYVWLDADSRAQYLAADPHTTLYLCVSATAARYADVAIGLDAARMRVVPNGIDHHNINAADYAHNREALRASWGIDADTPVFLNVASMMATKAQLPLVKAFAHVVKALPRARLVLLGSTMEEPYYRAVKNAVRDLQLQDNVIFAGYDRNVARYYHAADVFTLPSFWEGWSLSLGEAMCNGLACVITNVGSAYEFAGDDNVEIVAPPFGDITMLNYQNLGQYVYGEDAVFEDRLGKAMIKLARVPRKPVNLALAQRLDRQRAYATYGDIFSKS